jgi:hypothetical protein
VFSNLNLEVLIRVNLFVDFNLVYSKKVINCNFGLQSTFLTYCFENPNMGRRF